MKFFRSTIILFVVAVIAGFSYWYFIVKKGREKEEAEKEAAYLFEITDKGIARIILREKGKTPIELEKEVVVERTEGEEEKKVDKWHILSPVVTEGDSTSVSGLVDILKESKKEEVVWESLEKKSEYGLDDPDLSIEFVYEGEQELQGIDFGIENITHTKVFAAVRGKSSIYAVPVSLRNSLQKSLLDLRDKTICPYSFEDIDGVTYVSPVDTFRIEKEGEDWYFVPERVKASSTRMEIFTGTLRWGDFVEVTRERSEVEDFKKYGFTAPRMILNFKISDGSNYLFMVGDYETENNARFYYATRSSDSMIFTINEDLISRLLKTRFELKDRSIFPNVMIDNVIKVQLERRGTVYSFRKEGEDWAFADTGETLWRDYKIDNIVRGVVTAEYEELEPLRRGESGFEETGIDNPAYTITLNLKDGSSPVVVHMTEKDQETNKIWLTLDAGNTAYYTSGYFLANWPESREELLE
ncbi:MAG: hypothetical protein AMS17_03450 [Spirochaetes bacterium DG_61]|jgi:hypothetical protein|nr:MAG: hypothetical protein AMS17_03450 [Spirochaetes bacterium DG_61]